MWTKIEPWLKIPAQFELTSLECSSQPNHLKKRMQPVAMKFQLTSKSYRHHTIIAIPMEKFYLEAKMILVSLANNVIETKSGLDLIDHNLISKRT